MIYKFIDNNGSEIAVNSVSSLQSLVDSETVRKNTKVKAGLRGKWTTAENIPELIFEEKKENQVQENSTESEEDIRSFITKKETIEEPKNEIKEIPEKKPAKETKTKEVEDEFKKSDVEQQEETSVDNSDYHTQNYDNTPSVTFKDSWKICLSKITDFSGRASRSEFWNFYLSFLILYLLIIFIVFWVIVSANPYISDGMLDGIATVLSIPAGLITLSATVRRLHDTNKSGWFVLLNLIPLIGLVVLIMLLLPGDKGKNRFGDYPLKLKEI